jgi:hypothetical protein
MTVFLTPTGSKAKIKALGLPARWERNLPFHHLPDPCVGLSHSTKIPLVAYTCSN